MKNPAIQVLCLVLGSGCLTTEMSGQELEWLSHYGNGQPMTAGFRLVAGAGGTIYAAGTSGAPGINCDDEYVSVSGRSDALLVKLDESGTALWARSGGGSCGSLLDVEVAEVIAYDSAMDRTTIAGIYMTQASFGSFDLPAGTCEDGYNMFIATYSGAGDCVWAGYASGYTVRPDRALIKDSETYLFGEAQLAYVSFNNDPDYFIAPSAFVAKYAADGSLANVQRTVRNGRVYDAEWFGTDWILGGTISGVDSLWNMQLLAGSSVSDGFVSRASTSGAIDWVRTLSSDSAVVVQYCDVTSSGDIAVSGIFWNNIFFDTDSLEGPSGARSGFTALFDEGGNLLWAIPMIDSDFLNIRDQAVGDEGSIYLFGSFSGDLEVDSHVLHASSSKQTYALKLNADGECEAALCFGRTRPAASPGGLLVNEQGVFLSTNYDSTFVLAGIEVPITTMNISDVLVAKFDSIAGFSGVQNLSGGPETLVIFANPNEGICTVALPSAVLPGASMSLSIYDTQGRVVQQAELVLVDGRLLVDVRAEAKGLYHLELLDGARRYTGTIVFE